MTDLSFSTGLSDLLSDSFLDSFSPVFLSELVLSEGCVFFFLPLFLGGGFSSKVTGIVSSLSDMFSSAGFSGSGSIFGVERGNVPPDP